MLRVLYYMTAMALGLTRQDLEEKLIAEVTLRDRLKGLKDKFYSLD